MLDGDAKNDVIVGAGVGTAFTAMLVVAVAEPPGPTAVSVYVVLLIGDSTRLPIGPTVPTPWLIEIESAFWTDQLKVENWPT